MTDRLLRKTTSLCAQCKSSVPAELWREDGQVIMHKECAVHGKAQVLIETNADWYEEIIAVEPITEPPVAIKEESQGCPFDCGPCTSHKQRAFLPIVPITSSCNLDCPICYTHNKNEDAYHMTEAELGAILEHIRRVDPEKRIINLTGGEPTGHPYFERLIERCYEEGIHRITVSTHGLGLAKDPGLVKRLAEMDVRIILSFDSFTSEVNQSMLGGDFEVAKLRALELLEEHQIGTTLLPVLAKGLNDHEIGQFIDLALSKDNIRSVEFHTMTFTGQSGAGFDKQGRYTTYEVLKDIEKQTHGAIAAEDFIPSPVAHGACYLVTYLLRLDDNRWLPFPRFMEKGTLRKMLGRSLYLEPGPEMERCFADVINQLWCGTLECEDSEQVLKALKNLTRQIFAPDVDQATRMRRAEIHTKAVYVHAHMDEDTFDTDRIQLCPVGIREPDGTNIPSCAYNILYRERDPRFKTAPEQPLVQLGKGWLQPLEGPPSTRPPQASL